MIVSELRLRNFGIFYGLQTIDLVPGLYVFHGRNGRGKTTLLNAIRWALYGHFQDRQGREVPPAVVLNRQAAREGAHEFSVELKLLEGGDEYLLRRTQFLSPAGPAPSQLYMERNAAALSAGDRDRAIQQLLSERISQFFLFDGEQLQRYESLLLHQDSGSQLIKQSIEQILGLPVLDNALRDLAAIRDEFNRRLARQARQSQQLEQLGARAEQAQADLDSKTADIEEIQRLEEEQNQVIAASDQFLQTYENSLDHLKNLEALDEKVADLHEQRIVLRGHLADQVRESWRDVLAVAVRPKVTELRQRLEDRQQAMVLRVTREQLEASLAANRCVVCDQALDPDHQRHMGDELARMPMLGPEPTETSSEDYGRLSVLASIVNTGHAQAAVQLDRQIADLDSQELVLRQEIAQLRQALQNLPENEVTRAQKDRDLAQQELGRLRSELAQAQMARSEIEERLRRAQDEIRRASAGGSQQADLTCAIDLAESLHQVFDAAKDQFRDELRVSVEGSATEVFRQLTNEPSFERLAINDAYGLEIIDARGDVVAGRSAGQEQVVALSLIAALNRNARRRAPVMMDTPFGRLDPDHRLNILRFLPQIADQVFVLVHGGEVTDADLNVIAGSINEQFELTRDDTDRTTILPRRLS